MAPWHAKSDKSPALGSASGSDGLDRPRRQMTALSRVGRRMAAASFVLLLFPIVAAAPVSAATVTAQWQAKVGTAGVNGSATIKVFATGTGSVSVALKGLARRTLYSATIYRGTCARRTTSLLTLAAIRTTSTGTAGRTTALTAAQATLLSKPGKVIRLVAGTRVVCGTFTSVKLAPPPPPPPVGPAIAATIPVGHAPAGIAIDHSGVWLTCFYDGTLTRIDPATNSVLNVVPLPSTGISGPETIATGEGSLWVTVLVFDEQFNAAPGSVLRIDPATAAVQATIAVGKQPLGITIALGSAWVTNATDGSVMRIDAATNQVVASVPLGGTPIGVAAAEGSIWIASTDGTVTRIDPATNQVMATIHTQTSAAYVAAGGGAIWVTNPGTAPGFANGSLTRIDPATNQVVANVALGADPEEVAFGGGSVWVGMFREPTVVQVDASTNAILHRITVSAPVYSLVATDHAVWADHNLRATDLISPPPNGSVTRINY
jgi:virginiamycin B lyase